MSSKPNGRMSLAGLIEYFSFLRIVSELSTHGVWQGILVSKSHRGISDMNDLYTHTTDDLVIERRGATVTKVTKNGVVLWPQERHTAPMLTDSQKQQLAKEREWLAQGDAIELHKRQIAFESGSKANTRQEGGSHYQKSDATGTCPKCGSTIQHWDWSHNLRGLEYAATKYIARWRDKDGLNSLKKAIHYLQKLIEIHFPDVVVNVTFTNRAQLGGNRAGQTQISPCMASSSTAHPAAVDRPFESGDSF